MGMLILQVMKIFISGFMDMHVHLGTNLKLKDPVRSTQETCQSIKTLKIGFS